MALHSLLSNGELHEPKGIGTAVAGRVYRSTGAGSGAWERYKPDNMVYVHSAADLPAPSGGVITLADNTAYLFGASVALADPLVIGDNCLLDGIIEGSVTLSYSGASPFLQSTGDKRLRLADLLISCPNAPLLSWAGDTQVANFVSIDTCFITADSFGTINELASLAISSSTLNFTSGGAVFTGGTVQPAINIMQIDWFQDAGTCLDITATTVRAGRIQFSAFQETSPGVTCINSNGSSDIFSLGLFVIDECLLGTTTPLSGGVSTLSDRWIFTNALPLPDTQIGATAYLNTVEVITINTAGVYEPFAGGNWLNDPVNEAVTVDANGVMTYNGQRNLAVQVIATATVEKVGGGTDIVAARLAQNGTTVPASQGQTDSATAAQVTCVAILQIQPGDTLELQVANLSGTSDVTVDLASVSAIRVP